MGGGENVPKRLNGTPQTDGTGNLVVLRWSRHPRCVGLARVELRKAMTAWGLADIADSAVLVLSELLTNTVRRAHVAPGRAIETWYQRRDKGLRIEVHDADDGSPRLSPDASAPVGGHGFALVSALADRWDVSDRIGHGESSVWAELDIPTQSHPRGGA
ncbi:ATP-binding protein [Streptomyces sp. NPDC032198]|uniref:ATP-binding protein n=1 Tax=Streptomyces sp. NPDC032198 TaxID=3155127 RepID=UPI0033E8B6EF